MAICVMRIRKTIVELCEGAEREGWGGGLWERRRWDGGSYGRDGGVGGVGEGEGEDVLGS
jgi:hypothetical protein